MKKNLPSVFWTTECNEEPVLENCDADFINSIVIGRIGGKSYAYWYWMWGQLYNGYINNGEMIMWYSETCL